MSFENIPQAHWSEFLTGFTRMHAGWLASLESVAADDGPRLLLRDLPLVAVTTDQDRVIVGFAGKGDHIDHVVEHPVALWRAHTTTGADRGLDIDTDTGERLRLRFRTAVLTELVDGL